MRRELVSTLCITVVMLTTAGASSAGGRAVLNDSSLVGLTPGNDSQRDALAHAREIRGEVDARYRRPHGPRLAVTEASGTGVIDSFTLFASALELPRVVPAQNGIYFAVCPMRAVCPHPDRRFARAPEAFMPRRTGLELAVRTFLETSADLVVVSLPTTRFVLLVLERDDVMGEVDLPALRDALTGDPTSEPDARLRRIVDRMTLPRLFAPWALVPISETRETLVAACLWPISP